jgi:hypothetical protein
MPTDGSPALPEGAQRRRELALDGLRRMLITGPADRPLLVLLDDVQWCDPTTLELLGTLVVTPSRPVLLVCTARPEFTMPWALGPDVAVRHLSRLSEASVRRIVDFLVRRNPVAEAMADSIVAQSDGIPLFVEEITAFVAARAQTGEPADLSIPATILDLLVSRIDRLGAARRLLQVAAAIGREFDIDLLATVRDADRATIENALAEGDVADLVAARPGITRRQYAFRHALVRDAAYSTILLRERTTLHRKVAHTLIDWESKGSERSLAAAEVIAHHCGRAEMYVEAIEHYQHAATTSMATGANHEAVRYLDEAAALLTQLPIEPDRPQYELQLLITRGPALMAQLGYGHPTVAAVFEQARELCGRLDQPLTLFPVRYGLLGYSMARCDLTIAGEITEQLRDAATGAQDDGLLMVAHAASAQAYFLMGSFRFAAENAALCRRYHDPLTQADYLIQFGEDPATVCAAVEGWLAWLLGRPTAAAEIMEHAISSARSLGHQFTLAQTLLVAARLRHYLGDMTVCERWLRKPKASPRTTVFRCSPQKRWCGRAGPTPSPVAAKRTSRCSHPASRPFGAAAPRCSSPTT